MDEERYIHHADRLLSHLRVATPGSREATPAMVEMIRGFVSALRGEGLRAEEVVIVLNRAVNRSRVFDDWGISRSLRDEIVTRSIAEYYRAPVSE